MGGSTEDEADALRTRYAQLWNQLAECVVAGNIKKFKTTFESLCTITSSKKLKLPFSIQNDTGNPLFRSNLIILACKNDHYTILNYLFNSEVKALVKLYDEIGAELIHPAYADSFGHNAFYYAVRANNVKMVDLLIEKWPRFEIEKNVQCFEDAVSISYQNLKLRNVELSSEMEFCVLSRLHEFRLSHSEEYDNLGITMPQLMARVDLLVSKLQVTLSSDWTDQRGMLLFNLKMIVKNIRALKSMLRSTYSAIPWEEIEFCLATFIRTCTKRDDVNILYRSFITESELMSHLKNFRECLETEKMGIQVKNEVEVLRSFPSIKRNEGVKMITKKYPFFQRLYQDFERCRDLRTLGIIIEYTSASLEADVEEKEDRLVVVRTLQVIGQCFQNTWENPMLTEEARKNLFYILSANTRQIIIAIRDSLSSSFVLRKRAENADEETIKFFSELRLNIERLNTAAKERIRLDIFLLAKKYFGRVEGCEGPNTFDEISKAFMSIDFGSLILSGRMQRLQELLNVFPLNESLFLTLNAADFLEKVNFRRTSFEPFLALVSYIRERNLGSDDMDTWLRPFLLTKGDISEYNAMQLSRNVGFEVVDYLNIISGRIQKDKYYQIYNMVSEIIDIISFFDDNTESVDELHTRLRKHNYKFPFDSFEPNISSDGTLDTSNEEEVERITKLRSMLNSDSCNLKAMNDQPHCKEEKRALLILELLMVEILHFMSHSKEFNKNGREFFEARVPLLHGTNLLMYLTHNAEISELCFHDPAVCVVINAKLIASGKAFARRICLNDKEPLNDIDVLIKQEEYISSIVRYQLQLFDALSDGSVTAASHCTEKGADVYGRDYNGMTTLHHAAEGPNPELMVYILSHWKRNTDVKSLDGVNPFHLAVHKGRLENVKLLLTEGRIPVDAPDHFGRTGLYYSVSTKFTNVTKLLLTFNADPNAVDLSGESILKQALYCKNIEASKLILEQESFCYGDNVGKSPLYIAAKKGLSELLPTLIRLDSMKIIKNKEFTPLHSAAVSGHLECIKILSRSGLEIAQDEVLTYGVMSNNAEVVRYLLKNGADQSHHGVLFSAVVVGNVEIMELLMKGKPLANLVDTKTSMTLLHLAAIFNRIDIVELLLKNGARINEKDSNGQTALHYCAQRGYFELSRVLVKYGAATDVKDEIGCLPHFYAVLTGNQGMVEILVNSRNVNAVESNGCTALHWSCKQGNVGVVRCLLRKGAKVDAGTENLYLRPLHVAAMNGSREVVDLLLDNNASINVTDSRGMTALEVAAAFRRCQVVQILVQRGANINHVTGYGYFPLLFACSSGCLECCSALLIGERCSTINRRCFVTQVMPRAMTPLSLSVEMNLKSIVELLLKYGAKIDEDAVEVAVRSGHGNILELLLNSSPACAASLAKNSKFLLMAATLGHADVVKVLIKRGANINGECNEIGDRPLHGAVRGSPEIVQVLLDLGANPNVRSRAGDIPLHWAAKEGDLKTVLALVRHKSEILTKDSEGRTSLDFAVRNGHAEIVELFLNYDKHINVNNCFSTDERWPLLHIAAQSGKIAVVKLLVERGADINRKMDSGSKAIHIAAREGFTDMVDYLLSKGIGIYDEGKFGNTLLHYVAQGDGDRLKVAKYLVCSKHMDPNRVNKLGQTPFHIAAFISEDVPLMKFLMQNGAYYDSRDSQGMAAKDITSSYEIRTVIESVEQLFIAAKRGDIAQVQKSIRQSAIVDARNERSETPLICAAWKGNFEVVNQLLATGANPDAAGKNGSRPLHYASKFSHYDIVLSLLGRGAVFDPYNDGNKTPLDYATDDKISKFLKLIQNTFLKTELGNGKILQTLRKITFKPEEILALVNCKDRRGKTIIACAKTAHFPDLDGLQSVFYVSQNLEKAAWLNTAGLSREAFYTASQERATREALFTDDSMMNVNVDLFISVVLSRDQKYNCALAKAHKLFATSKKMLGDHNEFTMLVEGLIGNIFLEKGEVKRALRLFETLHEKQISVLSPLHPHVIEVQNVIGAALISAGQLDKALESSNALAEKLRAIHSGDESLTLDVQNRIASILLKKGKHDKALVIYKQVLVRRSTIFGLKHPDTVNSILEVAIVYFYQKKVKDAIQIIFDLIGPSFPFHASEDKGDINLAILNFLKRQDHVDEMLGSGPNLEASINDGQVLSSNWEDNVGGLTSRTNSVYSYLEMFNAHMDRVKEKRWKQADVKDLTDLTHRYLANSSTFGLLRESRLNAISKEGIDKKTAFNAIAKGDEKVVQKMIDSGIDFNSADEDGRAPLHFAVSSGSLRLVESLIENGAKVSVLSKKGNTSLHTAASLGRKDIAEVLLRNAEDVERLDFVDSKTSKNGTTALHIAASKGDRSLVKILLKNGATFNASNNDRRNPVDVSVDEEVTSTLRRLDDIFGTLTATINAIEGMNKDDWNEVSAARNAEGFCLLTLTEKCKETLDRLISFRES